MRTIGLLVLLVACGVQIPQGEVDDIARETCLVGHPLAAYRGARLSGGSAMGCGGQGTGFVLDITYKSPTRKQEDVLTVRYRVRSVDPCDVTAEVVADTGPPPLLLETAPLADAIGREVCAALGSE